MYVFNLYIDDDKYFNMYNDISNRFVGRPHCKIDYDIYIVLVILDARKYAPTVDIWGLCQYAYNINKDLKDISLDLLYDISMFDGSVYTIRKYSRCTYKSIDKHNRSGIHKIILTYNINKESIFVSYLLSSEDATHHIHIDNMRQEIPRLYERTFMSREKRQHA
jgi:hypothetical protein